MRFFFKVLFGSTLLSLGIAGVSYLQNRFDTGDEKKALQAVYVKHPKLAGRCRASMVSRVRGIVQVDCGTNAWIVDVLKGEIQDRREGP